MTDKILVSGWAADAIVSDQDWEELEAKGQVILLTEARENIRRAISQYLEKISLYQQSPRVSEVVPSLDEIAQAASALAAAISKLPEGVAEAVQDQVDLIVRKSRRELYSIAAVGLSSRRLSSDASQASNTITKSDLGREGDPYFGNLLIALDEVYRSAGGGRYTNNAIRFLRAAADLPAKIYERLAAEIGSSAGLTMRTTATHSDEAIKKRLQRALKDKSRAQTQTKSPIT